MRGVWLAMGLLLLCSAAGAEPGSRDDLVFDAPVGAGIVSKEGGFLAVGIEDGMDGLHPDENPDLETWFLQEISASTYITRQSGGADPEMCGPVPIIQDDCDSDVSFVAISANGQHMVAASQINPDLAQLVFVDRALGEVARQAVNGSVGALDIDDGGGRVAAGFDIAGASGEVRSWRWPAADEWVRETTAPVTALDMSPDGARVIVAAGTDAYLMPGNGGGNVMIDSWGARTVEAVSISARSDHRAAAADDRGAIRLYADGTSMPERILNIPGSLGGPAALIFASDGGQLAVAHGTTLRVWEILESPIRFGDILLQENMAAAIHALQHSSDGSHVILAAGSQVVAYAATAPIERLWSATLPAHVSSLSVDHAASRVAVTFGSTLRIFEPRGSAALSLEGAPDALPDATHQLTLKVANTGDQRLAGEITVRVPDGIGVTLATRQANVLPNTTRQFLVELALPALWPSGPLTIEAELDGYETTRTVNVQERRAWTMSAQEHATSKAIGDSGQVDFTLRLRNEGNVEAVAPIETSAPEGWGLSILSGNQAVLPGAEVDVVVRLTAPANVPKLTRGTALIGVEGQVPIVLHATVGASFTPVIEMDSPRHAIPGQQVEIHGHIRNGGNAMDSFHLLVRGTRVNWAVEFSNGADEHVVYQVPAGARVPFTIIVTAPQDGGASIITLEASSFADPSKVHSKQVDFVTTGADVTKKLPGPGLISAIAVGAIALRSRYR